jgi:putative DNA primase/helicase
MRLEEWLRRCQRVERTSTGVKSACPAHDDPIASLSWSEDGPRVLVHCFAGCPTETIVKALGREMRDLFNDPPTHRQPGRRIVLAYDYTDETGTRLYQNVRYEPKDFRMRRPDGDGWVWDMKGRRRVLYQLARLRDAD